MTPQIVSSNTYTRCFQYKALSNALILNKKLLLFQKSYSPLCSFSKKEDETVFHLCFYCPNVKNLWNQLKFHLAGDLMLPPQTLQAVVFGFSKQDYMGNVIRFNHLFIIPKLYVFDSRGK